MGVLSDRAWRRIRRRAIGFWPALALLLVSVGIACGRDDGGPGVYPAHGIVEDVDRSGAQVLIDHEDVPGLMPAMTMNFSVPDGEVLARLTPGQVIDFELRFTGRSYEVEDFEVVGEAPAEDGWRRLRDGLVRSSPAPDFRLIDQRGHPVELAALADLVLLVDFIYTDCPGPCPVQTSNQVDLQRRIPENLRAHVWFLSISLDPERDTPEALTRYAEARGVDPTNWSFLTGPPDQVAEVVRQFGVGSLRKPDGSIDHTLITFLVQGGRVMQRYPSSGAEDTELLDDVIDLAQRRAAAHAQAGAGAVPAPQQGPPPLAPDRRGPAAR